MQLKNTTKMAYQAAIAIAIAEIISVYFNFERGYWITLTAMALTTQTWGESVKRSFERVGMTILGGGAGTLFYFLLPADQPTMFISLLLIFIFFTVYTAKLYHLVSIFFLTCFVVFLFALLGNWTWHLLCTRILDTALGALIALTVGSFFFTLKTNITDLFVDYLQKIKALLATTFNHSNQLRPIFTSQYLVADFHKIRKSAIAIRYELLFHRLSQQDFNALLNQMGLCTRYIINIRESYNWLLPHLCKEDIKFINVAAQTTAHNIEALILHLQKIKHEAILPATSVSNLIAQAIEDNPARFATLESNALGFFSLMYFFRRLNISLNEIYALIDNSQ